MTGRSLGLCYLTTLFHAADLMPLQREGREMVMLICSHSLTEQKEQLMKVTFTIFTNYEFYHNP